MNRKQLTSIIVFIVGICLIIYANHAMNKIAAAKGFVHNFSNFFAHNTMWNSIITFFGGQAEKEASKYDTPVLLCLLLGLFLTFIGIVGTYIFRKRSGSKY